MITLLDIAKKNGSDSIVGLVEEATKAHPELTGSSMFGGNSTSVPMVGDSRTIKGISYKTLVRTGLPTVNFRDVNEGVAATKSVYENRTVECFTLNPKWRADKAAADRDEDGPEAYLAMEGIGHVEAAMQRLASQFYYGTTSDAKGFPGLIEVYDSTNMEVDAEGSSAGTGSSVWAVKWGVQAVRWVWGEKGSLDVSEIDERDAFDADNNAFTAYCQEMLAYPGLQVGTPRAVARIKDLTAESNKTLTDDHISDLLAKFEVGMYPDVLFMSRRSVSQLQKSRTATNATGAPAPFPTESFGVPILVTDAITNTETLT